MPRGRNHGHKMEVSREKNEQGQMCDGLEDGEEDEAEPEPRWARATGLLASSGPCWRRTGSRTTRAESFPVESELIEHELEATRKK